MSESCFQSAKTLADCLFVVATLASQCSSDRRLFGVMVICEKFGVARPPSLG